MGWTRNYYNWKYWFRERVQDLPIATYGGSSSTTYYYNFEPSYFGFTVETPYDPNSYPNDYIYYYIRNVYYGSSLINGGFLDNIRMNANMHGIIGDGNTNEDVADYKLDNKLSDISISLTSQLVAQDDDFTLKYIYILSGSNTTSEEITIKECGLVKYFVAGAESAASYKSTDLIRVLFFRKVLETPITVPVGKSFQITLEVTEDLGSPN